MSNLYPTCLSIFLFLASTVSFAEMYKWTDEKGQVHYTQTPPQGIQSQELKAPPPPTIDPNAAQSKIDKLIKQQKQLDQQRKYDKQLEKHTQKQQENDEKRCKTAKSNLDKLQNSATNKLRNPDGSITRLTPEMKQEKIKSFQDRIKIYCQ